MILKKFPKIKFNKIFQSKFQLKNFSSSTVYVEQMHLKWKEDQNSVHPIWDKYFQENSIQSIPNSLQSNQKFEEIEMIVKKLYVLIRTYRNRGFEKSLLDPLGN